MRIYFRSFEFQSSNKKFFSNYFKKSSKEIKKDFSSHIPTDNSTVKTLIGSLTSNLKMVLDKLSLISHKIGLKRKEKNLNYQNLGSRFNSSGMTNPKEKEDIATRDDLNKNKGRNQKDQPKSDEKGNAEKRKSKLDSKF